MRNKVKRKDLRRLTSVLLMLLMIMGSFGVSSFAQDVPEEKKTETTETALAESAAPSETKPTAEASQPTAKETAQPSAKEATEPAAAEQPAAESSQPENKGTPETDTTQAENGNVTEETQSEAEEAQPAADTAQPAEESEAVQPEAEMSEAQEAKNETPAKTIKVSYSGGSNGTVSAELRNGDSVTALKSGDTVDLTANANGAIYFTGQPAAGYVVKQFSISNGSQSSVISGDRFRPGSTNQISVKVSAITGDLSFSAEFEIKKYKVELTPDDGSEGTVTVDKSKAAEGETVNVKVVPAKGYQISDVLCKYQQNDGWYKFVDIEGDPATGTYSFKMPAKDIYVEASFFKPLTVKIKESKGGTVTLKDRETGKVIKSGDEVKPYQSIIVEAKPKSGYSFDKWEFTSADGGNVSFFKRDSYFRMRYADVTVEAIFKRNSSSGSGSGSGSGGTSYYPSSNSYYDEDVEEPEEPATEELTVEDLTEEEQEMLDVTPIVSRVVAETVLTATTSLLNLV